MAAISLFRDFNKRTARSLENKGNTIECNLKKRIQCNDAMAYKNKRKANCFDVYYMQ